MAKRLTLDEMGIQGCLYCGKLLYIEPDYDGYIYCSVCGPDGKNRKREYRQP